MKLLRDTQNKYGWYKQKNVWKNGIETIIDNDGILRSDEKHIEEVLDHKICKKLQ